MELLGDVVAWFADADSWQGEAGMANRLREHVVMATAALLTAAALALPAGLVFGHTGRGGPVVINIANLGRAVPSFAIIVIAAKIYGIGATPAFLALVALAVPPMVTNTMAAIQGVDPEVRESARGMGMTGLQVLARVEVPMGMPLIMAGVRTSGVQIVATASLAALVGWGGLGRYVIDGLATRDFVEVSVGALAIAVLSVLAELALGLAQRALVPEGLHRTPAAAVEEEVGVPLVPGAPA